MAVRRCPNCRAKVPGDEAQYCDACGTEVPVVRRRVGRYGIGGAVTYYAVWDLASGKPPIEVFPKTDAGREAAEELFDSLTPRSRMRSTWERQAADTSRTCVKCGSRIRGSARYCQACGTEQPAALGEKAEPGPVSPRQEMAHPRSWLSIIAAVFLAGLVLGGGAAVLFTRSASEDQPRERTPTEPASSPLTPSAEAVDVEDLIRTNARIERVLYGDLDEEPPDEILVHSTSPSEDGSTTYVEVFAWNGPGWARVFDASETQYLPDGTPFTPVPQNDQVDHIVGPVGLVDFHSDGAPEIVLAVTAVDTFGGPLTVYVLRWDGADIIALHTETTTRGGTVTLLGTSVRIVTGHYEDSDPLCCPSGEERIVIGGWDIGVIERSVREARTGRRVFGRT